MSSADRDVTVCLPPPSAPRRKLPSYRQYIEGSNYTFSVFEVQTAVLLKIQDFWSVEPCGCFEGTLLHGKELRSLIGA